MSEINGGNEYNPNDEFNNARDDLSDSISDAAGKYLDNARRNNFGRNNRPQSPNLNKSNNGRVGNEAGAPNNAAANKNPKTNAGKEAGGSNGQTFGNKSAGASGSGKAGTEAGSEAGKAGAEAGKTAAEAGKTGAEAGKAGTEAGTAAAGAGATAATGGAAGVAILAVDAGLGSIKGQKAAFNELTQNGEDTRGGGIFGNFFKYLIIFGVVCFLLFMGCFYTAGVSSSQNENNQEIQYVNQEVNGLDTYSDRNEIYTENDRDKINRMLDCDHPYSDSAKDYKEKTNEALEKAFTKEMMEIIEGLNKGYLARFITWLTGIGMVDRGKGPFEYRPKISKEHLWANPYPYNLKINYFKLPKKFTISYTPKTLRSEHEPDYYCIGDYLKTVGYSDGALGDYNSFVYKSIADEINNDLNFSELTVVISQGQDYTTDGGTFENFFDEWFDEEETRRLLFEMTVVGLEDGDPFVYEGSWKTIGLSDDGEEIVIDEGHVGPTEDPNEEDFDKCTEKWCYVIPVVKPYGLRELYKLAGVEEELVADDVQPGDQPSINHPPDNVGIDDGVMNYEMLDYSEKYDRIYARMGDLGNIGVEGEGNFMGPSCLEDRSYLSILIGEDHTIDKKPLEKGRSANWYIPVDLLINAEDLEKMVEGDWDPENKPYIDPKLLEGISDPILRAIIQLALEQVGKDYVWGATGPNSFDCSGLIVFVFRQYGKSFPHSAAGQYNSTARIDPGQIKPGDLVFKRNTGDRVGITHVGLYIGNGKVVEARGKKYGVVITDYNKNWIGSGHFAGVGRATK